MMDTTACITSWRTERVAELGFGAGSAGHQMGTATPRGWHVGTLLPRRHGMSPEVLLGLPLLPCVSSTGVRQSPVLTSWT